MTLSPKNKLFVRIKKAESLLRSDYPMSKDCINAIKQGLALNKSKLKGATSTKQMSLFDLAKSQGLKIY